MSAQDGGDRPSTHPTMGHAEPARSAACSYCEVSKQDWATSIIEVDNRTKARARPPRGDAAEQISNIFSGTHIVHKVERA